MTDYYYYYFFSFVQFTQESHLNLSLRLAVFKNTDMFINLAELGIAILSYIKAQNYLLQLL